MPHVLRNIVLSNIYSLPIQLGGILFTPSVFIDCLISNESRSSIHCSEVLKILGRSPDFFLNGYIIETDKNIVKDNLRNARKGGYLSAEKFSIIENALNSLKIIQCNHEIEEYAHYRSSVFPLYDARRIEAALQNDLTLLTCTPEHFTQDPDEQIHIFQYGYADICVGVSIDIEQPDIERLVKIWVFNPKTLAILLNGLEDQSGLVSTDRSEQLHFESYKLSSNNAGSFSRVRLTLDNRVLVGEAQQEGPIDAILRAIEDALNGVINMKNVSIHHRVSDTTTEKNAIRVFIRLRNLNIGNQYLLPRYIEATDESKDLHLSTARAYAKALNTLIKEIGIT